MKKMIIGLMMTLVMVFAMVNAALAAGSLGDYPTHDEAMEMLKEWCNIYGYEKYVDFHTENEIDYYLGYVDKSEFEDCIGCDITIDNYIKACKEEFSDGLEEIEIKMLGEIEGNSVYHCEASGSSVYGYNGKNHVKVIFMICD